MLDFLLAPQNLPFAVALAVMLLIGAAEAIGLGAGAVDLDADVDAGGDGGDLLGWLGVGRVPLLIVLVVLLALFGLIGLAGQKLAAALTGGPLPLWLGAALAFVAALPLTGVCARALARILPQDETTAVSRDKLLGKRAEVLVGEARRGSPARARVRDVHGQVHYVMIEPTHDDVALSEGATVLLVRREGDTFFGLPDVYPAFAPVEDRPALTRS